MTLRNIASLLCSGALCLTLGLLACSSAPTKSAELKPENQRRKAPGFELKDAQGKTVRLSDYHGKVVLLNFWATWCGPCRIEIPWFKEFERMYKDRGFAVLGVAMDEEGWEVINPYVEKMQINYRILLGTDMVADLYGGVGALPTSFVIDREGRIAATHVGLVSRSDYEKDIQALLDQGVRSSRAAAPPDGASAAN